MRQIIRKCLLPLVLCQVMNIHAVIVGSQIGAGSAHSLFIKPDSSLWAMGGNFSSQLGDGTQNQTNIPEQIVSTNVAVVAAGYDFSLFLDSAGNLWAMGDNARGQLGLGSATTIVIPTQVANNVVAIAAGHDHSLFCKADGSLWGMGNNISGALGDGTFNSAIVPEQILPNGVTTVVAGQGFSLFIKTDGSLWAMGNNSSGQLGDGNSHTLTNKPEQIVPSGVVAIAVDYSHTIFVKSDGSLWAMGENTYGELGDGTTNMSVVPEEIVSSGVTAVCAGFQFSLFIKSDGSLWSMGVNSYGQLGSGTNLGNYTPLCTPMEVVSSGVIAVSAGDTHTLFLKSDQSLWAMGNDWNGQLGDGFIDTQVTNNTPVPEQICPVPPPFLSAPVSSGTNVQVQATCLFGHTYCLYGSTNITLPRSQWTPLQTNSVCTRGTNNFLPAFTNSLATSPQQFYFIRSQ